MRSGGTVDGTAAEACPSGGKRSWEASLGGGSLSFSLILSLGLGPALGPRPSPEPMAKAKAKPNLKPKPKSVYRACIITV